MGSKIEKIIGYFKEYPDLYDTQVKLTGYITDTYLKTTEGTTLKRSVNCIMLHAGAKIMDEQGRWFIDEICFPAKNLEDLPSFEEVDRKIRAMAEKLVTTKSATLANESYVGPVLFIGQVVPRAFQSIILAMVPTRKNSTVIMLGTTPMTDRLGTRIMDARVTIKNLTTLENYKGKPVIGAYEVDADGVIPKPELTLIENGVLKNLLNDRVPKENVPRTTGSTRWGFAGVAQVALPGVLHVTVNETSTIEKLKKELIKAAKKEGNDCAYIVRNEEGVHSEVYQIDLKTGKEILIKNIMLPHIRYDDLHLLGASEEEIINTPYMP